MSKADREAIKVPFLHTEASTRDYVILTAPVGAACPFDNFYFLVSLTEAKLQSLELDNGCNSKKDGILKIIEEGGQLTVTFVRFDGKVVVRHVH